MLKLYLKHLAAGKDLSLDAASEAAARILISDPIEAAAFLALLHAKGVKAEELAGFAGALRRMAKTFTLDRPFVDIVGTGGDGAGTINISTASALLAAASGIPVVKHGNRAATSSCGAADLMEAFGAELYLEPPKIQQLLNQTQFAFCFAPHFHPAFKHLREVKKKIGIPSILNLAGPLLHPAGTDHLLLGVYSEEVVPTMARALQLIGTKRSLVFSSHGLDELSCIGPSKALLVTPEAIETIEINPEALGLRLCTLDDLKGGSPQTNHDLIRRALSGEPCSFSDALVLNAAAALILYGPAKNLKEGVLIAQKALKSGEALRLLGEYCKMSKQGSALNPPKGKPFGNPKKSLKKALEGKGISVIAEIKRASPSKGPIADIPDPAKRARLYVEGGAKAISVLTHGAFQGSLDDLQRVAEELLETNVPVMRKDFIRTREEVFESLEYGADALLLIVSVLMEKTGEMLRLTKSLGMEALVEVHTKEELQMAIDAGAEIIGVNQRDLSDFSLHPEKFSELAPLLPKHCIRVAESGLSSVEEAFFLGYDAVLIGEALSSSKDPKSLIEEMVTVCQK